MTITGSTLSTAPGAAGNASDPFRVMVVDDSSVIRGLLRRNLETDPSIKVIATAADGAMAVKTLKDHPEVEVMVLDIEMPVMDGITALPKLLEVDPTVQIVMASTLTQRNAEISLKALASGAADYIPKPTSTVEISNADAFRRDLVSKVIGLGAARRRGKGAGTSSKAAPGAAAKKSLWGNKQITLRPAPLKRPDIIAIGSSTGGPKALIEVLSNLTPAVKQPILITQHMPPTFTSILAEHIQRATGRPSKEAAQGDRIEDGKVYVAPGDFHMTVKQSGVSRTIEILQTPPENFCRPAVDPMLRSIAQVYGPRILVVILTGMGADGMKGSRDIVAAGGAVLAQDEASSVVWGMPGAVATDGTCSAVLPVSKLGAEIVKIAGQPL